MNKFAKLSTAAATVVLSIASMGASAPSAHATEGTVTKPHTIGGYAALCGGSAYKQYDVSQVTYGTRSIILRAGNHFCAFAVNMTNNFAYIQVSINKQNGTETATDSRWTKDFAGPVYATLPRGTTQFVVAQNTGGIVSPISY